MSLKVSNKLGNVGVIAYYFVGLLILLLVDLSGFGGVASGLRRVVLSGMRPIVEETSRVVGGWQRQIRWLGQIQSLARQNLDLERRVEELLVLANEASVLREENGKLREALKIDVRIGQKLIRGKVIGFGSGGYLVWFDKPVEVGSAVMNNNYLVGVIAKGKGSVVEVETIGTAIKPKIRFEKDSKTYVLERRGGVVEVVKVLVEEAIEPMTLVVTAQDNGLIPPDLPVGRVAEVKSSKEAVYATVLLGSDREVAIGDYLYVVSWGDK